MIHKTCIAMEAEMTTMTVSPKFQVVIPRGIRKILAISAGQKMQVVALDDRIVFIPLKPAKALRGFVQGMDTTVKRDKTGKA